MDFFDDVKNYKIDQNTPNFISQIKPKYDIPDGFEDSFLVKYLKYDIPRELLINYSENVAQFIVLPYVHLNDDYLFKVGPYLVFFRDKSKSMKFQYIINPMNKEDFKFENYCGSLAFVGDEVLCDDFPYDPEDWKDREAKKIGNFYYYPEIYMKARRIEIPSREGRKYQYYRSKFEFFPSNDSKIYLCKEGREFLEIIEDLTFERVLEIAKEIPKSLLPRLNFFTGNQRFLEIIDILVNNINFNTSDEDGHVLTREKANEKIAEFNKVCDPIGDDISIKNVSIDDGFLVISGEKILTKHVTNRLEDDDGVGFDLNSFYHYGHIHNFLHGNLHFLERHGIILTGSCASYLINRKIQVPGDIDLWVKIGNTKNSTPVEWKLIDRFFPRSANISRQIYSVSIYQVENLGMKVQLMETLCDPRKIIDEFDFTVSKAIWDPKIYNDRRINFKCTDPEVIKDIQNMETTFLERPWDITKTRDDDQLTLTERSKRRIIKYLEKGFKIKPHPKSLFTIEYLQKILEGSLKEDSKTTIEYTGYYVLETVDPEYSNLVRKIRSIANSMIKGSRSRDYQRYLPDEPIIGGGKIRKDWKFHNISGDDAGKRFAKISTEKAAYQGEEEYALFDAILKYARINSDKIFLARMSNKKENLKPEKIILKNDFDLDFNVE
jgi:hypothetical protein